MRKTLATSIQSITHTCINTNAIKKTSLITEGKEEKGKSTVSSGLTSTSKWVPFKVFTLIFILRISSKANESIIPSGIIQSESLIGKREMKKKKAEEAGARGRK